MRPTTTVLQFTLTNSLKIYLKKKTKQFHCQDFKMCYQSLCLLCSLVSFHFDRSEIWLQDESMRNNHFVLKLHICVCVCVCAHLRYSMARKASVPWISNQRKKLINYIGICCFELFAVFVPDAIQFSVHLMKTLFYENETNTFFKWITISRSVQILFGMQIMNDVITLIFFTDDLAIVGSWRITTNVDKVLWKRNQIK